MKIKYLFLLGIFLIFAAGVSYCQSIPGFKTNLVSKADTEKKEDLSIRQQQREMQASVKSKEGQAQASIEEAEKFIDEKGTIEGAIKTKEEVAADVKQELEAAKSDPKAKKKVKQLNKRAVLIDKEIQESKEKLQAINSKALSAQEAIILSQQQTESVKKALDDIRRAKAARRPFIEKVIMSVTIVFIGVILFFFLRLGLKHFERVITHKDVLREDEATLRMKTLISLFSWLGNLIIFGIVIFMVLENFGLNMTPFLAGAGIVGIAFGFGGQYLIRDLINGLFILIEGQYSVNDVVKINEYGGLVENINLRITTLRDLEGRVIIIPNGEIKIVVNYTRDYSQALFDIGIAYEENVDEVMEVVKKLGSEIRQDKHFGRMILADLEMLGVDAFEDSGVTIKFRIKTLPIKQWEVAREFRRRLKNRFDELKIEIPFPHRTLYWGTGKDNDWFREMAKNKKLEKKG